MKGEAIKAEREKPTEGIQIQEMRLLCNISRNNAVNDDTYYA